MRIVSAVMAGVFGLAVAVQWNDPDPLVWMALYAAAALLSLAAVFDRFYPGVTAAALAVYGAGVLYTFPAVLSSRMSAYTSFEMRSPSDEVAREGVGLILCAVWMLVLWVRAKAPRRADR